MKALYIETESDSENLFDTFDVGAARVLLEDIPLYKELCFLENVIYGDMEMFDNSKFHFLHDFC